MREITERKAVSVCELVCVCVLGGDTVTASASSAANGLLIEIVHLLFNTLPVHAGEALIRGYLKTGKEGEARWPSLTPGSRKCSTCCSMTKT